MNGGRAGADALRAVHGRGVRPGWSAEGEEDLLQPGPVGGALVTGEDALFETGRHHDQPGLVQGAGRRGQLGEDLGAVPVVVQHLQDAPELAVDTAEGLVVPVVRDADQLSLAGIEKGIAEFGRRARDGQLKIEDMQGGTFTITNGGIYGSLMSTPILNAPQSGILGMHKIQERPMVVGGKIEVRPMMYLALSYDHRIVDGKEAVTFLVRVKECLEDPARLVLDL